MLKELESLRNLHMEKENLESGKVKELLSVVQKLNAEIEEAERKQVVQHPAKCDPIE